MKTMLFKPAATLALLAGLVYAGSAGAATTLTISNSGNADFGAIHDTGGAYSDDYIFTVDPESAAWATVTAVLGRTTNGASHPINYTISDVSFYRVNPDLTTTLLTSTSDNSSGLLYFPTASLAPGEYGFTVKGATQGLGGGTYTGTLNLVAAPVPEPAGYAMLGIGLGLLGFTARRQRNDGRLVSR
jgi:hypothetical protein